MPGKRIGVVLVHGVGEQRRYDFLKEFSAALQRRLAARGGPVPRLMVDTVELNRMSVRARESSDLSAFFGSAAQPDAATRDKVFQPVSISVGEDRIHFYEAYWADEDLRFTWYENAKFLLWLATIPWNLLWNLLARRYRPRPPLIRIVRTTVQVLVVGLLVHLAEVLAVLCRYVFRRSDPFRKTQQILYEYAQTPSPAGVPVLEGRAAEAAAASENGSAQRRTLAGKERSLRPPCLRLRRW